MPMDFCKTGHLQLEGSHENMEYITASIWNVSLLHYLYMKPCEYLVFITKC